VRKRDPTRIIEPAPPSFAFALPFLHEMTTLLCYRQAIMSYSELYPKLPIFSGSMGVLPGCGDRASDSTVRERCAAFHS
jgi:hypothetical protein